MKVEQGTRSVFEVNRTNYNVGVVAVPGHVEEVPVPTTADLQANPDRAARPMGAMVAANAQEVAMRQESVAAGLPLDDVRTWM